MRVAIIGGGISGLTVANLLKNRYQCRVFEKESTPGGLIRCLRVQGSLFHTCGGHVFNSKRADVLEWFWSHFSQDIEFTKANRNSVVAMGDGSIIPYPIENHMYLFDRTIQESFIKDLLSIAQKGEVIPHSFEEFLRGRFGETLYRLYFQPYNEKVWRRDLSGVPLTWLDGKLPMPSVEEIIYNNMNHIKERIFVHSSFWYEKEQGSQFIADRLSNELDIQYNVSVESVEYDRGKWTVFGDEFDAVVFCGNIKDMVRIIKGVPLDAFLSAVSALEYHGTTSVFCEIDRNPYSWVYQPSPEHSSHRIICTGNFAASNNNASLSKGRITSTVEFTDYVEREEVIENLSKMPFNPKYIDQQYNEYTYPIQDNHTRSMIGALKAQLAPLNFYFTGRFADWEYYNMDVAIGAAMDLCNSVFKET